MKIVPIIHYTEPNDCETTVSKQLIFPILWLSSRKMFEFKTIHFTF